MTTFGLLSPIGRALFLLAVLLLLLFSLFNLLRVFQLRKKGALLVLCITVIAAASGGMQPLFHYHLVRKKLPFDPPLWLLLLLLLVLGCVCAAVHIAIGRRMRESITAMSVKESFDNLPTGLCCWFPGGLLKLVNTKMDVVSNALCGRPVQNGEAFRNALLTGEFPGRLSSGEQPIYQTPDGAVYSFRCYPLELEDRKAFEMVAVDVTQEYKVTRQLEEKQRQVQMINTRLRSLNSAMEYLNMNRELLALKAQLHDQLGQSLLYAKRCLAAPDAVDREELRALWMFQIRRLKNESPEDWQTPYFVSAAQAEKLGITLKITGELPYEERLLSVVDTAITTHLTNVLRHANGKTASVVIEEAASGYTLIFTNDGCPPVSPVSETGGLQNLRREVEYLGGTMDIRSEPAFQMTLFLPKGGA